MTTIIVKKSKDNWSWRKNELHKKRKELANSLSDTIFSKSKMDMQDCQDKDHEEKRVADYDKWKTSRDSTGLTNEQKMTEWSNINREFKKHNEEGRLHTIDDIRNGRVKYD
jgi:hypothetical protein